MPTTSLGHLPSHLRCHVLQGQHSVLQLRWNCTDVSIQPSRRSFNLIPKSTKAQNTRVDEQYMPFLDAWDKTFTQAPEEQGYYCSIEEGEIPVELEGTLFRNGSNEYYTKTMHPYDGDGFVASLAIKNGQAFYRARFVKTYEYEAEKRNNGKVLFRGTFATQRQDSSNFGDLYVRNTSNTNVQHFNGKLWSLFEAGQPYALDPFTLETIGIDTLGGAIKTGLPFDLGNSLSNGIMGFLVGLAQRFSGSEYFKTNRIPSHLIRAGGDALTAHPHITDGNRFCTFSYQMKMGIVTGQTAAAATDLSFPPMYTQIQFMEFVCEDEMKLAQKRIVSIPGFAFLHDFAITNSYYIIFKNPVTVDNATYISGNAPAASCVRWLDSKPTVLYLIPRDGHSEIKTFNLPGSFVFHHANAYEDEDEDGAKQVIIDSIHYQSLPAVGREALPSQRIDPNAAFHSRLKRVRIQLNNNDASGTSPEVSIEELCNTYIEMPSVNPSCVGTKHRFVYGYVSDFPNERIGVAQIDTETSTMSSWYPEPKEFLLEPHFIPKKTSTSTTEKDYEDSNDGWVLAQYIDSRTESSGFFLFDASAIDKGPICKIGLRETLPSGLHGCFTQIYYGPSPECN